MIFNPVFEAADKYFKCFLARLSFAGITHFFKPFQENNIWVVPGSTVVEHSILNPKIEGSNLGREERAETFRHVVRRSSLVFKNGLAY